MSPIGPDLRIRSRAPTPPALVFRSVKYAPPKMFDLPTSFRTQFEEIAKTRQILHRKVVGVERLRTRGQNRVQTDLERAIGVFSKLSDRKDGKFDEAESPRGKKRQVHTTLVEDE